MRDLPLRAGRPWIAAAALLLAAGGYAGHHAAASRAGPDPLPAGAPAGDVPVEAAPAPGPAGAAVQPLAAPEAAAETVGPPDRGAPPGPVAAPRAADPVPSPSVAGPRPAAAPSTAPGRGGDADATAAATGRFASISRPCPSRSGRAGQRPSGGAWRGSTRAWRPFGRCRRGRSRSLGRAPSPGPRGSVRDRHRGAGRVRPAPGGGRRVLQAPPALTASVV
jgi:hypothetical protein